MKDMLMAVSSILFINIFFWISVLFGYIQIFHVRSHRHFSIPFIFSIIALSIFLSAHTIKKKLYNIQQHQLYFIDQAVQSIRTLIPLGATLYFFGDFKSVPEALEFSFQFLPYWFLGLCMSYRVRRLWPYIVFVLLGFILHVLILNDMLGAFGSPMRYMIANQKFYILRAFGFGLAVSIVIPPFQFVSFLCRNKIFLFVECMLLFGVTFVGLVHKQGISQKMECFFMVGFIILLSLMKQSLFMTESYQLHPK